MHITGTGSCTITAAQGGDVNYNAATSVARTFTVVTSGLADQVIVFGPAPTNVTLGDPPVTVSATSTSPTAPPSNIPIIFSSQTTAVCTTGGTNGATVTLVAAGICTIAANQAGNANYNPAPQVLLGFSVAGVGPPPTMQFNPTGAMATARSDHTATLLLDGRVLIAGGLNAVGAPLNSAELYCPDNAQAPPSFVLCPAAQRGAFSATNNMPVAAAGHTATRLHDGTVLVLGGGNANVQWFTPSDQSWGTLDAIPIVGRAYHTATLLRNGTVFVAGGLDAQGAALNTTFILDPTTTPWTVAQGPNLNFAREGHTATLLPDDTVLIAGGRRLIDPSTYAVVGEFEVYDPSAAEGAFGNGEIFDEAAMSRGRFWHAADLVGNRVVITGGSCDTSSTLSTSLASTEYFDLNTGAEPPVACASPGGSRDLQQARRAFTMTALRDGSLLAIGGADGAALRRNSSELFSSGPGTFSLGPVMTDARAVHQATLLLDGRVLVSGGIGAGGTALNSAEVFSGAGGGSTSNQPPTANAGPDQTVVAGTTVQLTSAGSSDPEATTLSYSWSFVSKSAGSAAHLSNAIAANPTFLADKKGTYVVQLIVTDSGAPPLDSAAATVRITATNRAPVAVADAYSVASGATLTVNAASGVLVNDSDADGDVLTASVVANVTHGALTSNTDGGFTYTPTAGYSGPDSFTYRANDGTSDSNTVTVSLTVTSVNHPPVANAGTNQNVSVGQLVQLNGACTDIDGDPTTRTWSFTSLPGGSSAALSSVTTLNPTFTPDLPGSYQLQLVCNDGHVDSAASGVVVTAVPNTIGLTLASPLTAVGQGVAGTITLGTAAPGGGLQVTLVSSNTGVATVAPSPVIIAAGSAAGSFTVTGVALGTATITASATAYSDGTVDIGVTGNAIAVGNVTTTPGQAATFTVTLTTPAPAGGVTVNLVSSNIAAVTVPASVFIAAGATAPATSPAATGVALGTATITASAVGYAAGTGTATTVNAGPFVVTNTSDSGAGSLRDAIAQANLSPGADVITFAANVTGTITLTTGQIRIDGPLTIVGPGRDVLAIDGNASGRIFTIIENNAPACPALSGPADFVVSISGLTLKNGSRNVVDSGGGAIQSSKSLLLDSVTIRDSQAKSGGGLSFNAQYPGQVLAITNSQFINNVAKPVIAGDTGSHNGGALIAQDYCTGTRIPAVVSISTSVFSGNRVQPVALEGRGGAIANYVWGSFVVSDTRIVDNHVEAPVPRVAGMAYPGGGMHADGRALTILRSEIAGNSADYGGGLNVSNWNDDLQAPSDAYAFLLLDSTVSGNTANVSGGAINLFDNVAAELDNSTLSGNSAATAQTGGIRFVTGTTSPPSANDPTAPTLQLVSSIIANSLNSTVDCGAVPSTTIDATNSLVQNPLSSQCTVAGTGNLTAADPLLAPLADNGGLTRTHALLAGSPAIDTGSNPLVLATDQRGTGFARVIGAAADMGAYEAPAVTNHPPVANAGSNQSTFVGQLVQLSGTCTDIDGDVTTATWSFASRPAGSNAVLSSTTIMNPTFTPDVAGSYQPQLICNDGHVNSSPSTVVITVAPNAIVLTLASPLVGVGRTINGTITLPQPAPAGGSTVTLSSGNTALATIAPPSVSIAAGGTSGSFTVTGVALGGPVTLTAGAAGFTSGTTGVTVTNTLISLGALPAIGLGQSVSLPISLTAGAPAGGVTVNFTSSDTSVATVTTSVFIAAGQTIPVSNPQVNGVNIGTAQINAVAPGFAPDVRTANVQVNVTFTPTTLSVVQSASQNITVNLSAPAPAGGLTVGLTTANPAIATAVASVTIPAGQLSAPAAITGVAVGSTTVQATGSGVTSATATINVTVAPVISLGAQTIGKDLQVQPTLSLGAPAPAGGLVVTLTSLDTSKVLLSTSAATAGSPSITVTIPAGQTSNSSFVIQSLSDVGTATVTASAAGFANGTSTITMAPSGFYDSNPGGNFTTTTFSANTLVRVQAARLNASGVVQTTQQLRAGIGPISVPVTVVDVTGTNVGSITTSPLVFNAGDTFLDTAFHPLSAGTAQITVGVPAGFSTPQASQRQATATVTAPTMSVSAQTIGKDLQVQASLTLGAPAPAGGLVVTLTSLDTSKVLLSTSGTVVGGASITVTIPAGQSSTSAFFMQSLSDVGTATVTASAAGFANGTSTITMAPSGFYDSNPGGNFTTTTFSANTLVRVQAARLNASGVVQTTQQLRAGIGPISVPVTVVDVTGTNVGSITTSPLVFNAGDTFLDTAFHPLSAGTAQISVGVPAGFSTPQASQRQATATVTAPTMSVSAQTIGKDLQVQASLTLGAPAPAGGLVVTLTSLDTSKVLLSTSGTVVGGASITVTIPAGQSSTSAFFMQSLSDVGTATVTASAAGFANGTSTITMAPSGFYDSNPGGNFTTTTFSANTLVRVQAARLNASGVVQTTQQLRAGIGPISVPVTVVDVTGTNVGSITTSPLVFNAGDTFLDTAFHPLSAGTAQITVGVPAGFSTPQASQRQFTATVTAPAISSGSVVVGRNLQSAVSITLGATPPSPVNVTVSIASGTIAAVSGSTTVVGGTTLSFNNVTTTSVGTFYVSGLALGSTLITVQAPGYADDTSTVTVQPSGFANSSPGANFSTTALSTNTLFRVQPAQLNPTTLNVATFQALRPGLTVDVPVTSSDPSVGGITVSPLTFVGGDTLKDTAFDPLSTGATVLSVGVPAGFDTPSNSRLITATVNQPALSVSDQTIGANLQVQASVSLGAAAPAGGLVVTLTSSDPSKVLLSTSATAAGSASVQVTALAGQSSVGGFFIQSLDSTGTATVTATATAFATDVATISLTPSGFANSSPGGNFSTTAGATNTLFRVQSARLDPTTLNVVTFQSLRGGIGPISVPVTSDTPTVGGITVSPVTFNGGDSFKDTAFDPLAVGTTNLTIGVPPGFSTPSNSRVITATVN